MNPRSLFFLTFVSVAFLAGCGNPTVTPVAAEPDIVTVKLAQAADKAANALDAIANIEQQRNPATPPLEDYTVARPNLMQTSVVPPAAPPPVLMPPAPTQPVSMQPAPVQQPVPAQSASMQPPLPAPVPMQPNLMPPPQAQPVSMPPKPAPLNMAQPNPVQSNVIPPSLMQPVSIRWSGGIEPLAKTLAEHAGLRFHVKGNIPPIPLTVNVDAYQLPIVHVLRDIGLQAGHRADIVVDSTNGIVELRYAPADLPESHHVDEAR